MNKLYLCCFLLLSGAAALAQETTTPVWNKSNRILLHFTDTTGLFTQLARLFIDRGYDIYMKDRELGILRTEPRRMSESDFSNDQLAIKTIFRDSTITFSGELYSEGYSHVYKYDVVYAKKLFRANLQSWEEMQQIAALLQPASITYLTIGNSNGFQRVETYRRMD
ncbi:hypothetical protein A3860_39335 [Niastella vici]|uniref:Uncharacterized protein n=1 Tax=Niastella vici TaxID=1703345 RepID=A0A1V9FKS9_9BACT|nr:hypothetical protein [Niastella vici]OQP58826.1 hypothetical protein A3860_39335 [Niastella vici]